MNAEGRRRVRNLTTNNHERVAICQPTQHDENISIEEEIPDVNPSGDSDSGSDNTQQPTIHVKRGPPWLEK